MAAREEDLTSLSSGRSELSDPDEEEVDPRVKEELECLNSASEEINKLEIELEHSRTKFRSLMSEATARLNLLYKKLGRCINKTRAYYALYKDARRAQAEAQKSVVNFQRANGYYLAAKETVALAEETVIDPSDGEHRQFDSAWQEMLNHATMKFMESEKEKTPSEQEHLRRAAECAEIEKKLKVMEKDMPRSIPKARPYFDLKEKLEFQLQQEKMNVEDLQRALTASKQQYRATLNKLESISEEVHKRRQIQTSLPPRTPGVGAEFNDSNSDLPSINLDIASMSEFSDTCESRDSDAASMDSFNLEQGGQYINSDGYKMGVPSRARDLYSPDDASKTIITNGSISVNSCQLQQKDNSGDVDDRVSEQNGKIGESSETGSETGGQQNIYIQTGDAVENSVKNHTDISVNKLGTYVQEKMIVNTQMPESRESQGEDHDKDSKDQGGKKKVFEGQPEIFV